MTTVIDQPSIDDDLPTAPQPQISAPSAAVHETALDAAEAAPEAAPERASRILTGRDYLAAAGWGLAGAVVISAASLALLPIQLAGIALVLGAGLGVLGYLDHLTQLIRNRHTLAFGAAAALMVAATQVATPHPVLLPAVIGAVVAFVFMLGLTVATGFAGGGDIKLSPVPAALLAAVSPVAATMWLLFTFVLALGAMIAARLSGSRRRRTAMAPYMALAAVLAIVGYGMLARALGI